MAGPHPIPVGGNALGAAIRAVSAPHDTIVTIWGHADVTHASGLRSPYPYLWYLPARTLDPHVRLLATTLAGRAAPTWFVDWTGTGLHGTNTSRLTAALRHDYHRVADVHGVKVFLHDGVHRHAPVTGPSRGADAPCPLTRSTAMEHLVVVPTYNERATIDTLLAALEREAPTADVLVVDDSSPDGTAGVVRADPRYGVSVFLLERDLKEGLGPAYRSGFDWPLAHDYEAVVQMDADLSHPPARVPALVAALDDAEVVVGSRYVTGGAVARWSARRRLLSWAGNRYVRLVLTLGTHDTTAGFKAFRASALRRIDVTSTTSNGYCFQVESTWRAERRGLRVVEVPITFTDRTLGESKMSGAVIREALVRVLVWRLDELRGSRSVRGAARRRSRPAPG